MLKRYQHTYGLALRVTDACIVVGAWLVSCWIRFDFPYNLPSRLHVPKELPDFSSYAAICPLIAVLWPILLTWTGVYRAGRFFGRRREAELIMKGHLAALASLICLTYFFNPNLYSRLVLLYFAALGGAGMIFAHVVLRTAVRELRKRGINLRHVLVVGEGLGLKKLIERLEWYPEMGLRIRGVLTCGDSTASEIANTPVLGHYSEITDILHKTNADEVFIALPPSRSDDVDRLLTMLKDETIEIRIVPEIHRYATLGCEVESMDGIPVLRLNGSRVWGWDAVLKRVTDVVVSLVASVVLSPVLLIIAAGVKLTSRGPVLYQQVRIGLDGQHFAMLKFRTMRVDAEGHTGAVWAQKGDDRCTSIGRLLRKTSLDELPQLLNVLRGDMSLVGPRPERPPFVDKFRSEIPHYMLRHKVRAGMTGWAQVNGWRGNTSLDRRIECDLFYIRNWSYLLDMKILIMTIWRGFVHKNAY